MPGQLLSTKELLAPFFMPKFFFLKNYAYFWQNWPKMLKLFLFPFSILYSFVVNFRNFLYDHHFIKSYYFHKASVISIGNLAVGGTGKTPMTEYILKSFPERKIAVLSRGYKRKSKGFIFVTADKKPVQTGDEPLQMAQKFPNHIFAVCKDRREGIKKLIAEKDAQNIVLDDAFQHRKINPKLSILLTEYHHPFFKDHFLPVGRLRDNKQESHRADIIVVTKAPERIYPIEKNIWKDNLKLRPYQSLFFSSIHYGKIINLFESSIRKDQKSFKNHHILIVTGIANHKYFAEHIKEEISQSTTIINFSDHKNYTQKDIDKIMIRFEEIKAKNKIILTTEKDAIKLRILEIKEKIKENIFFQEIEMKILFNKEAKFKELIRNVLS